MEQEKLNYIISKIDSLPTLPTVLTRVLDLMKRPDTSAKQITETISKDPSISSKVLKLANSSYYGFSHQIENINHAVVILGMDTVKALLLATSVFDMFPANEGDDQFRFDHEQFWQHSLGCAVAAKTIGSKVQYGDLEEIFLAGLLHDIGKIIIDQYFPDEFAQIIDLVDRENVLIVKAEEQILGINHAILGKVLAKKWNLPDRLVNTIASHHSLNFASSRDFFRETAIIHLADILCRAKLIGNGGDKSIPVINKRAWKHLGLSLNNLESIMQEIGKEYRIAYKSFFGAETA